MSSNQSLSSLNIPSSTSVSEVQPTSVKLPEVTSMPIDMNTSAIPTITSPSTPAMPAPVASDTSFFQRLQNTHTYNAIVGTQKNIIRKIFDSTVLNPLKCQSDGLLQCDFVVIYIILMIVALIFLYIFKYNIDSKFKVAIDWILISIIFSAGLLILINLCLYKKPSKYAIVIIAIALFALYMVMTK